MASKTVWIVGAMAAAGALIVLMGKPTKEVNDVQIDPDIGKHRGLAPMYAGPDQNPDRLPSKQDIKGGQADYLGYPYGATRPSVYAKGEPSQKGGEWWNAREDQWAFVDRAPIDYEKPPLRIPKLWKDANRFWDGITSWGGTEVVGQRVHLFHLRPSMPTRGARSISGSIAPIGGGQSTASRMRIPAIFVPSSVA